MEKPRSRAVFSCDAIRRHGRRTRWCLRLYYVNVRSQVYVYCDVVDGVVYVYVYVCQCPHLRLCLSLCLYLLVVKKTIERSC